MNFVNNRHLIYGRSMINDPVRNSFYKKMLEKNVKDKRCLEIGFGTGLLSIMALEAGAKSIVAYEEDIETYNLGKYIVDKLQLENRITLIHDSISSTDFLDKHPDIDVVFTETINSTLWGECFLSFILPPRKKPKFLPEQYFLDIHALEVSNNFITGLLETACDKFNPGVEIDKNFVKTINEIIDPNYKDKNLDGLYNINFYNHINFWGSMQKVVDIFDLDKRKPEAGYVLDVNAQTLSTNEEREEFTTRYITKKFELELKENTSYILIIRTGISFDGNKLYLDKAHWGEFPQQAAIVNPTEKIVLEHNLFDGNFFITYKDQKICLIKEERSEQYQHITETDKVKVIKFTA